jgi:hypothetical protein
MKTAEKAEKAVGYDGKECVSMCVHSEKYVMKERVKECEERHDTDTNTVCDTDLQTEKQ